LGRFWHRTIRPLLVPIGLLMLALLALAASDLGLIGRAADQIPAVSPAGPSPTERSAPSGTAPGLAGPEWSATAAVARQPLDRAPTCRPDDGQAEPGPGGGPCTSTVAPAAAAPSAAGDAPSTTPGAGGDGAARPSGWQGFDAGNIISDAVFYDRTSMSDGQIGSFIQELGRGCQGEMCLKDLRISSDDQPADRYCSRYLGGTGESAAAVIAKVSRACGVNPQVLLVTLQKESGLLTRSNVTADAYSAAWGWKCPDTGPQGTADCDPAYAGFFAQAYGMGKQWSRYRNDPERYTYRAGQTADILWNIPESGCGSAPVTIRNTATASLYNYTPYQPNPASLAGYPGPGDRCSSYGNRNFFFLFQKYFGSTGAEPAGAVGVTLTIPDNRFVDPQIAGRTISAPTAPVAAGLAAGLSTLGLPYVWGGGGSGAGPDNGCARGAGLFNSCGSEIGFDCSGLTAFVLGRAGFAIPGNSTEQRRSGDRIGWDRARPGDIVGFPGHVAIYLGAVAGTRFILEASWVGTPVRVTRLIRGDADPVVYRFWAATPVAPGPVSALPGGRNDWSAPDPGGSGFVPSPGGRVLAAEEPPPPVTGSPAAIAQSAAGSSAAPTGPDGTPRTTLGPTSSSPSPILTTATARPSVGPTGTVGSTTSMASLSGTSASADPGPSAAASSSPAPTRTTTPTTTSTTTTTTLAVPSTTANNRPTTNPACAGDAAQTDFVAPTDPAGSADPAASTTPSPSASSSSTAPATDTATPTADAPMPAEESITSAASSVQRPQAC